MNLAERNLRRGIFGSVPDLIASIETYLEAHNEDLWFPPYRGGLPMRLPGRPASAAERGSIASQRSSEGAGWRGHSNLNAAALRGPTATGASPWHSASVGAVSSKFRPLGATPTFSRSCSRASTSAQGLGRGCCNHGLAEQDA